MPDIVRVTIVGTLAFYLGARLLLPMFGLREQAPRIALVVAALICGVMLLGGAMRD